MKIFHAHNIPRRCLRCLEPAAIGLRHFVRIEPAASHCAHAGGFAGFWTTDHPRRGAAKPQAAIQAERAGSACPKCSARAVPRQAKSDRRQLDDLSPSDMAGNDILLRASVYFGVPLGL